MKSALPSKKKKLSTAFNVVLVPESGNESKVYHNITKTKVVIFFAIFFGIVLSLSFTIIYYLPHPITRAFFSNYIEEDPLVLEHQTMIENLQEKIKETSNFQKSIQNILLNTSQPSTISKEEKNVQHQSIYKSLANTPSLKPVSMVHEPLNYIIQGSVTKRFNASQSHYGLDVATSNLEPIGAYDKGSVVFADWISDYGYVVILSHSSITTFYKHCGLLLVKQGEMVQKGDVIALTGSTGTESLNPHLHFELWMDGIPQDPSYYLLNESK